MMGMRKKEIDKINRERGIERRDKKQRVKYISEDIDNTNHNCGRQTG